MLVPVLALLVTIGHPVEADAASRGSVKLKTTKKRTVNGPLTVLAVPRGRPLKVTFFVDGKRRYVARKAPFSYGGANGRFDPRGLTPGTHVITVRAYFVKNRYVRVATKISVRKRKPAATIAIPNPEPTTTVTTTLPSSEVSVPTVESVVQPVWDGSAKFGLPGSWSLLQPIGNANAALIDSPVLPGHKAFKFTVDGGERVELNEYREENRFNEGDEWWFGDVLYVPGTPNKQLGWDNGHHTFMQWKNIGTGSPPIELDRRQEGLLIKTARLVSEGSATETGRNLLVPEASLYDRPIRIEVRVKFSSDPAKGEIEAWVDGKLKVPTYKIATLYAGKYSYLKQGQYGNASGNVVIWHGAKRGHSRESVVR